MTAAEFSALIVGRSFQHDRKHYKVVQQGGDYIVSSPHGSPRQFIHFFQRQAPDMVAIQAEPEMPARPVDSHGFPVLQRSTPRMPQPYMSSEHATSVCIAFDGGLSEARQGNAIGSPIREGLQFLRDAVEAGINIQICTHRTREDVYEFLRVHCPGLESIVHASPQPPPPGMLYLSRHAFRIIDDAYPTVEELAELLQPQEEAAERR